MAALVPFDVDLTAHESARLAAVLDGFGYHWDPVQIYTVEAEAHRLLYSELDPDQQASYHLLVAEGVLPATRGWPR